VTVVEADALPDPAFELSKAALLVKAPHDPAVVALTRWTCVSVAPATVAGPARLWFGGEPVIDQSPGVLFALSMAQLTPVRLGRRSVTDTPVAASVPEFVRLTVNPICEPALTVGASVVLPSASWAAPAEGEQLGNLNAPMRVRQLKVLVVE
jgi:hypothetical protein